MTHKITVKLFAQQSDGFAHDTFVPILHSWIQFEQVPDHLLVDVTDYGHVPDGPGTVLVSHEANFYVDRTGGRLGLTYQRKSPAAGTFRDQLKQAILAAKQATELLENDGRLDGKLRFKTDEIYIRLNDRLNAPNKPETFNAIHADVESVLRELFGRPMTVQPTGTPEELFGIHATAA
jgi:hypothetical protein